MNKETGAEMERDEGNGAGTRKQNLIGLKEDAGCIREALGWLVIRGDWLEGSAANREPRSGVSPRVKSSSFKQTLAGVVPPLV